MNCSHFRERLPEYLDDSLLPQIRAAAARHVTQCAECRAALERAHCFAEEMQSTLTRMTAGVSVRPNLRRQIVCAAREMAAQPSRSSLSEAWQWLAANPFRALGVAAGLACLLGLGAQLRRPLNAGARSPGSADSPAGYVVDVPFHTETRVFQYKDGKVIDAVVTTVLASRGEFTSAD
jgi:anti-sigma factor RsiW